MNICRIDLDGNTLGVAIVSIKTITSNGATTVVIYLVPAKQNRCLRSTNSARLRWLCWEVASIDFKSLAQYGLSIEIDSANFKLVKLACCQFS